MNIIFFSNSCWSIYNFRINLIKYLLKENTVIILGPFDGYQNKLVKLGCKVFNIKIDNNKKNVFLDLLLVFDIIKILYKYRKKSVLLNFTIKPLIYGTFSARLLKIPCICMITGLGTMFIKNNYYKKLILLLYKISFKKVHHVFFQNRDDKNIFKYHQIIKERNCSIIPGSGVDLKKFKFSLLKKKNITTCLLVARLVKEKGIMEYINIGKIIKKKKLNIKLNLLGSFVQNNESSINKKIILEAHKKKIINFISFKDDVRPYIKDASCVVLPSYREGTSRSLLEAAAIGRAIITNNVPGCREIVRKNKNGYICKLKSERSLLFNIIKFHQLSFSQKKKMGVYSHKFAKDYYNEQFVISSYKNILRTIF